MSPAEDEWRGRRLLAHLRAVDTKWFKVSAWLLEVGRHRVPETRNSYNPIKWIAAQVGCWMGDRQIKAINRRFNKEKP